MSASESSASGSIFWMRSLLWLLFLGPFFFLSYSFSNHWAAHYATPGVVVFEWERHIPFVPWTILPYWSIDVLYGLSFLLCRSRREVDTHALRLLTAQLISVSCFVLFPLHFSFERPPTTGFFGTLFDALHSFDQPFNQAPSLHISLLVIIWARFAASARGGLQLLCHAWAVLIGVSVLTTYQHHFVDVPTGVLVGMLCLWIWPSRGASPLTRICTRARTQQHQNFVEERTIAAYYLLGALCLGLLGGRLGGAALWLFWPVVSLLLVFLNYRVLGAAGFQKHAGRLSTASQWLYAPYTVGAWINAQLWIRLAPHATPMTKITPKVWVGCIPSKTALKAHGFHAVLDCCAELPVAQGPWVNVSVPWLDLLVPDITEVEHAAQKIEQLQQQGKVFVCCALGYSRSALAVAAWLLTSRQVDSVKDAVQLLRRLRPHIVLKAAHIDVLIRLHERLGSHHEHPHIPHTPRLQQCAQ